MALPTQATSTAMSPRLRAVLEGVGPADVEPDLRLIHGASALHLAQASGRLTPNTAEVADRRAAVEAAGWFAPRTRTLWATYAVGTVDQALMAALAVRHSFVRLAGLASKAVIIDEVHAYDVYMSSILERLLRWLAALGTPVALLSATLPAQRRAALLAAYTGSEPARGPSAYPLIAQSDPSGRITWLEPAASGRRSEVVLERRDEPHDDPDGRARLADELLDRVADGGCLAWVHNTVDSAQAGFQALRDRLATRGGPAIDLILLHARFRLLDRQQIEAEVMGRFGAGGSRPARAIVVATQVIEQSLDVDFDLLVSHFAPVDLLLQRLGRVHRHATTPRPARMSRPRLILLTPPRGEAGRPRFGPTEWIYDRFVLLKTWLALKGLEVIRLPEAIRGLVESVYDDAPPDPGRAIAAGLAPVDFEESWAALEAQRQRDRGEARIRLLPPPHPDDPFYLGLEVEFEDRDQDAQADQWIAAKTRLGRPSRAVILLHRRAGGLYLDPVGGRPLDLERVPGPTLQRELLLRSVTVSWPALVRHLETLESPPGLRDCSALRRHAVLELENGRSERPGCDWSVRLDSTLGIVYERGLGRFP